MTTGPPPAPPRRRLNVPLLIVGLVAVLVAGLVVVVVRSRSSGDAVDGRSGLVTIRASDGVRLAGRVTRPAGDGPHPVVIMPTSFGASFDQYRAIGRRLTALGFVTVAYTQRGFGTSGGDVDLAGPATQRDARTVINWALRNTTADPSHVGMLGVSYGAGISLLTAARDSRVRAVVALSGWTDVAAEFRPRGTLAAGGLNALLATPRPSASLRDLTRRLQADPVGNGPLLDTFARPRSPATYLAGLNRNRVAVLLANGWQDTLFSPAPIVPFFSRLTTPKRLQLSIGDHGGPEGTMLQGQDSRTGRAAYDWLTHYLQGRDNGIDRQPPVQLQDVTTGRVTGYPAWPRPARVATTLAAPSTTAVALASGPVAPWQAGLTTGADSAATVGPAQYVPAPQFRAPTAPISQLAADRALVWGAAPLTSPVRVLGSSRLTLSVAATAPAVTLFAYLYDEAADGTGTLLSMTPFTVTSTPGVPRVVTQDLEPVDATLVAGHRLALVVDTVDPWWTQAAPQGSTVTLSSTAAAPAGLGVPVG